MTVAPLDSEQVDGPNAVERHQTDPETHPNHPKPLGGVGAGVRGSVGSLDRSSETRHLRERDMNSYASAHAARKEEERREERRLAAGKTWSEERNSPGLGRL